MIIKGLSLFCSIFFCSRFFATYNTGTVVPVCYHGRDLGLKGIRDVTIMCGEGTNPVWTPPRHRIPMGDAVDGVSHPA